ncbi:MAG: DUF6538 domain-containing protein, partial [Thiohalocapsa sp.]
MSDIAVRAGASTRKRASSFRRRTRSGEHLLPRGGIYYYRRAVPAQHRKFFGCWEVKFSLHTSDYGEAKRLEKRHDSEFEERLAAAIATADPHAFAERVSSQIVIDRGSVRGGLGWTGAIANSSLRGEDAQAASNLVREHLGRLHAHQDELRRLLIDVGEVLPATPLPADVWQQCREGILSIVRYQVGRATENPAADPAPTHTMDWAYERWLLVRRRPPQTEKEAKDHLSAFITHAKIALLSEVRRSHLVAWRDALVDVSVKAGDLSSGSVNQRLTLVMAILRVGWREAEMSAPDLKMITLKMTEFAGGQPSKPLNPGLRDALIAVADSGIGKLNKQAVANWIARHKNKIIDGYKVIEATKLDGYPR